MRKHPFTVILLLGGLAALDGQNNFAEEENTVGPAALTAEQMAKLKERDRIALEAVQLRGQGNYAEALIPTGKAVTLTRAVRGEEHAEVAEALTRQAELLELAGDLKAAEKDRKQILALRQKSDGERHWRTAEARLTLAFTEKVAGLKEADRAKVVDALHKEQEVGGLQAQGKNAAAESEALKVVEVYRAALGDETAEEARVWHLVGRARLGRNDPKGAKKVNEQALAIRRRVLPADHPDVGRSLNNLGLALQNLSDLKGARRRLEEAVGIWKKSLGRDDPLTTQGLNNLGIVQDALGEYGAAKKSYEEALAIRRRILPKDHLDIAVSLTNLAFAQATWESTRLPGRALRRP